MDCTVRTLHIKMYADEFVQNFYLEKSNLVEIEKDSNKNDLRQLKNASTLEKQYFLVKISLAMGLQICAIIGLYCCFNGAKLGTVIWGKYYD